MIWIAMFFGLAPSGWYDLCDLVVGLVGQLRRTSRGQGSLSLLAPQTFPQGDESSRQPWPGESADVHASLDGGLGYGGTVMRFTKNCRIPSPTAGNGLTKFFLNSLPSLASNYGSW
jgi:hypothetical protein